MQKTRFLTGFFLVIGSFGFSSTAAMADQIFAKIQVGDKWVYQETDNITKSSIRTDTVVVTDITNKTATIVIRFSDGDYGIGLYDYNGNVMQNGSAHYNPNDGSGIPEDAKLGTTWKQQYAWRNPEKNQGGKGESDGSCEMNEQVTVPAAKFDTLKCIVKTTFQAGSGGVKEVDITNWYSPQTLLPLKREIVVKRRGLLVSDVTQELIEYHLN